MTRFKLIATIVATAAITAAGTTVATAYVAPDLLPQGQPGAQGQRGPIGPIGPEGPVGLAGNDGADGADGADAEFEDGPAQPEEDLAPNGMHMPAVPRRLRRPLRALAERRGNDAHVRPGSVRPVSALVQIVQWVSECDATPVLEPMPGDEAIAEIAAPPPNVRHQFDLQSVETGRLVSWVIA